LAWFIIDVVNELDVSGFLAAYRGDGRGGRAYDPVVMVGILVYAYCVGERSSRRIERKLVEDVGFRVVGANQHPDHATLARFRADHQDAIAGLFTQVLGLCGKTGLLEGGMVAVDGTKLVGNASRDATVTARGLAERILAEAAQVDAAEDLTDPGEQPRVRMPGRGPDRRVRLRELLDELDQEAADHSYEAHLQRRADQETTTGRRMPGPHPVPGSKTHRGRSQANLTDPDSRLLSTRRGFVQGYNAQAVVNTHQVVVAAQATNKVSDSVVFHPMMDMALTNLAHAGAPPVSVVLADAGYWAAGNTTLPGVTVLIAPGRAHDLEQIAATQQDRDRVLTRVETGEIDPGHAATLLSMTRTRVIQLLRARRQGRESLTSVMMARLTTPDGHSAYQQRKTMIEPVFGQIKHNRGIRSFHRRGLPAVDSEWKLICTTHNLLKIFRKCTR